jgi:hypothetical protein
MDGDLVGGPATTELAGAYFVYRYSTGRKYRLEFTNKTVTFQLMMDPETAPPARTLAYRARKLRDDLFLVHWMPSDRSSHVALVIDLANHKIHVSGVLPGHVEFFDVGEIEEIKLRELGAPP